MAQYIGFAPAPADLPGPSMTMATTVTATPDMAADIPSPTVTNRDTEVAHSDPTRSTRTRLTSACATATTRGARLALVHRWELAPVATAAAITTLGWAQSASSAAGWETAGWTVGAVGAGLAAAHGIKHKHPVLFGASAGLGVAMADVAVATGAGFGAASMTVAAISTALAYTAYWPWLVRHRREQAEAAKKQGAPQKGDAEDKSAISPALGDAGQSYDLPDTAPVRVPCGPFHDRVIPYADDDSDDVRVPIRIGWDEYGQPTLLTILSRHTLVAGACDWGKSGIINLIIKKLLKKKYVEVYGIDLKPGTPELGPWAPRLKGLARTPKEVRALFDKLEAEAERRGALLKRLSDESLTAGGPPVRKWIPGDPSAPVGSPEWGHGPVKVVITDELGELTRQDDELRKQEAEERKADPEFGPAAEVPLPVRYESGLAVWRFLEILFVSATQQPSNRVFGGNTDARGNYGNRISTRAGEAGHGRLVFGEGSKGNGFVPEKLTRPGEFFFASAERPQTDPPRNRAEYVTDEDIAADVSAYYRGQVVQEPPRLSLVKPAVVAAPPAVAKPPAVLFPDGTEVTRASHWLDLYKVFQQLCAEQGHVTKDDLVAHGPYESRDTVKRALDEWLRHGVEVRKAGRFDQFYLPDTSTDSDD